MNTRVLVLEYHTPSDYIRAMASASLLSDTIEADDESALRDFSSPSGNIGTTSSSGKPREPVRLVPGTQQSSGLEEGGIVSSIAV